MIIRYLLVVVWTLAVVAVYHYKVAEPRLAKPVYTVDMEALEKQIKDRAVNAMVSGEKIKVDEIIRQVQQELYQKIDALPEGALVLDSKAVVDGEAGKL